MSEVRERLERDLADFGGDPSLEWFVVNGLGMTYAMQGRFDEARAHVRRARALSGDLGLRMHHAATAMQLAEVEVLAGDLAAAEADLRWGIQLFEEIGLERIGMFILSMKAYLLDIVSMRRDDDEAEALVAACAGADPFDVEVNLLATRSQARLFALRGELAEAERVARQAVLMIAATDALARHGDTLIVLADVLERAGRRNEAAAAARDALLLYEQKGVVVSAARTREWLTRLDATPVS